ncbi:STAS domain-containing protein [Saccharopolyspora griseoalba]|uniref:Anti-sigma factor antagonist n=1 Tax=Saccharopolyspora griseoalba TaxID=1431848 RepID=A0ABW2LGS7_9PSEU
MADPDSSNALGPTAREGRLRLRVRRPGGGVVVVQASGSLDAEGERFLTEPMRQRLAGTASKVVLDLSGVSFADSAGVRVLLEAANRAECKGKEFVLVSCPPVDRLLRLLGLTERFVRASSAEAAAAANES